MAIPTPQASANPPRSKTYAKATTCSPPVATSAQPRKKSTPKRSKTKWRVTVALSGQFKESARLEAEIRKNLAGLGYAL